MKAGLEWELPGLQGTVRTWLESASVGKKEKLAVFAWHSTIAGTQAVVVGLL